MGEGQSRVFEQRACQGGRAQVGLMEIRSGQVGATQIGTAQVAGPLPEIIGFATVIPHRPSGLVRTCGFLDRAMEARKSQDRSMSQPHESDVAWDLVDS